MMPTPTSAHHEFSLAVMEPYHPEWIFGFLGKRALAGVERVTGLEYQRDLGTGGPPLSVAWHGAGLRVRVPVAAPVDVAQMRRVVRRMFDVDFDPTEFSAALAADECLGPIIARAPGLRVPGAFDGFETAVRAVLGQQVSVARATALANRMIERYGDGRFPLPGKLVDVTPAELGMPGRRGQAIAQLARRVLDGEVNLEGTMGFADLNRALLTIDGVGPWTAGYIAMRVARDPDAFVESDWVVRKQLRATPAVARRMAEAWRPWRAYAVMYLWWAAGAGFTS